MFLFYVRVCVCPHYCMIIGDAYSMKTYQSITSLATSPAISNNSLYSNGFFVTTTPPPPPPSSTTTTQFISDNIDSSSTSATVTTMITTNNLALTPILQKHSSRNATMTTTRTLSEQDKRYQLPNEDHFFRVVDKDESPVDEQNDNNDINILISNFDLKHRTVFKHLQNEINIESDDDGDELSVENTRL